MFVSKLEIWSLWVMVVKLDVKYEVFDACGTFLLPCEKGTAINRLSKIA